MALFRVVLIDKDPQLLEYLNGLINWQENGYTVVGAFTNTEQSLEYCRENPPELIITDYALTGTDGMPLAKSFLELHRRPRVVILTDTPDFSHAQKAIQMRASSLLVKAELSTNSLLPELNKLHVLITAEKNKLAIVKRQLVRDLVRNRKLGADEIFSKLEVLPGAHQFVLLLIKMDMPLPLFLQKVDFPHYHVNWHGTPLPDCFEYVGTVLMEPNTWVMLLRITEHLSQRIFSEKVYSAAHAVQCNFEEQFSNTVSVATSDVIVNLLDLPEISKVLKKRVRMSVYYRPSHITPSWHSCPLCSDFASVIEEGVVCITENMDTKNLDKMSMAISATFSHFMQEQFEYEGICVLCDRLIEVLNTFRKENSLPTLDKKIEDGQLAVPSCFSVKDVFQWMLRAFKNAVLEANQMVDKQYSPKVQQIIKYINRNYSEIIAITDLSERFSISNDYLRHIFKKQTGQTVLSFITMVKIEHSKRLLKDGRYRIFEVAEMTGYSSSQYFSYVFKKITGQTPSEYLESLQ